MGKTPKANTGRGIYLRGKIFWFRFSSDGRQQFISLQTRDPVEAVARAARAPAAVQFAPKAALTADIERFISSKRLRGKFTSDQTEKWARRALKHLTGYFPSKSASTITPRDMEQFRAHLLANQAETGAMSYLRAIKSFFSWTVKEKVRFENPCAGLVHAPKEPARKKFATKTQRDALIDACEAERTSDDPCVRNGYHEAVHFALYCSLHAGMRYNEIIQARSDWFHLEAKNPYVEIQNTISFRTKNKRTRTVPLSTPFIEFLKIYGLREPFMLMSEKEQGKNAYRYDFRKPWTLHVTARGLPWLTPHVARHTFASILVQSDTSIFKVAKWMGHGVQVCERHYAHLSPGDTGIDKML